MTPRPDFGWRSMETAPKDGRPVIVRSKRKIDRGDYLDRPSPADHVTIAWWGQPGYDYPRRQCWISAESVGEVFEGSELTGSWTEYEFVEVDPEAWSPLPQ